MTAKYGDVSPRVNWFGGSIKFSETGQIDYAELDTIDKSIKEALDSHVFDALKYGTGGFYTKPPDNPPPDTTYLDFYEDQYEPEFVLCPHAGDYVHCHGCPCSEVHGTDECAGGCCHGEWECAPVADEQCIDLHKQYDIYHPITIQPSMPANVISPRIMLDKFSKGKRLPSNSKGTIRFRRYT